MKKIFMLAAALAITVGANAQIKFGAKAGLNLSQFSSEAVAINGEEFATADASKMRPGFFISGHVNFGLGEFFGVQPEVGFSMQGGKYSYSRPEDGWSMGEISTKTRLNYITIPVLFEVKPITGLSLFVGPQIGFNVYKSTNVKGVEYEIRVLGEYVMLEVCTVDFAAVVGLQYAIMNRFLISARYNIGFTPTSKNVTDNMRISGGCNRVIQIGVGYQF